MTNPAENFATGKVPNSGGVGDTPITKDQFQYLQNIVIGILIVAVAAIVTLLFALGTILIDHFDGKRATFEDLRDEVERQSYMIETLIEEQKKESAQ